MQGCLQRWRQVNRQRLHLIGSSLGAFIQQQVIRMAPHTFCSLLDISGVTGVGRDYLIRGQSRKALLGDKNMYTLLVNDSHYQDTDPAGEFYLDDASKRVRDLTRPIPLCDAEGMRILCLSGSGDPLVSIPKKELQLARWAEMGADAELVIIGPEDVDGKIIKHCGHAFGGDFHGLIREYAGDYLRSGSRQTQDDFSQAHQVSIGEGYAVNYAGALPSLIRC